MKSLLPAILSLIFLTCSSKYSTGDCPGSETLCGVINTYSEYSRFIDGFCGEDAYRIAAEGVPVKKPADADKMKEQSRQAAILNAQHSLYEKFTGACVEQVIVVGDEKRRIEFREKIHSITRSGRVIYISWDKSLICHIIYEVSSPGLRRMTGECR